MGLEGTQEVELDDDFRGCHGFLDLHPPGADLARAVPGVDGARAAGVAAERSLHRRVELFPGRPDRPLAEVDEQRIDLRRLGLDRGAALNREVIGSRGREAEHAENENDDDTDGHPHANLLK
jgi:hypothetical protein